jgi:hypothetical protein
LRCASALRRQKAQIRILEHEDRSTRRATALLRQLEMTLHLMNGHRAVILQKAPRAALMQETQRSTAASR